MAWTAPTDRITGDIITAAQWNALLGATGDLSLTATGIVTTQGDMVYATAANTLARLAKGTSLQQLRMNTGATAPEWATISTPAAPTYKYMTATQVFTTTTTFADVVTTGATTMSFAIAASEVWNVTYRLPLAFGGTGGVKFQLTGPASPTAVSIGVLQSAITVAVDTVYQTVAASRSTSAAAFSTAFADRNSNAGGSLIGTVDNTYNNFIAATSQWVEITAFIANGANAGTVTLQAAQNSSNSTTTLGIGSHMRADKVA